jgi:hypothetical protein
MEELARRLMSQPHLSEPIEAMLRMMEEEIASGCSADAVEAKVIEQVRALGRAALQGWAQHAGAQAQPLQEGRPARRHSKKNSGG